MIKIKTQSNTVSITDTAVQATPLVEEEVGHINIKVSKVKMRTRSELATDNIYVTAKNMITLNQIHKGVDDAAVQIYPEPTIVAVPTLSGTYTYTGQEQTVTISTYDPLHIAVSGDTAATNAGTYTVVFSLVDTDADVWEDGTTEDKTATWVIGKVTATLTFSGSYSITQIPLRKQTPIYAQSNGFIGAVTSSDPSVVQLNNVTVSNQNVNFVAETLSSGTATIEIEVLESENVSGQIFTYNFVIEPGLKAEVKSGYEPHITGSPMDADNLNEYAIIAGDSTSSYSRGLLIITDSLTYLKKGAEDISVSHLSGKAISHGNYFLLAGGGSTQQGFSTIVDAYNTSLVHSNPTNINRAKTYLAGATVGNYALFCGGKSGDTLYQDADAYNLSLTHLTPANLQNARSHHAGTKVGNYALFVGGYNNVTEQSLSDFIAEAYNASLTRSVVNSQAQTLSVAGRTADYAVILTHRVWNSDETLLEVYNSSLTRTEIAASAYTFSMYENDPRTSVPFKGYALFPFVSMYLDNSLSAHNMNFLENNFPGTFNHNYAVYYYGYDKVYYSYVA